jgi:hypothetical protein
MSELTREQIKAWRETLVAMYWQSHHLAPVTYDSVIEEIKSLCDLALQALTVRSEGFREGVAAAAWAIGELDGGEPERDRAIDEAIATVRALSPRETDADAQVPGSSPRETKAPSVTQGQGAREAPLGASAPSAEVAERDRLYIRLKQLANGQGTVFPERRHDAKAIAETCEQAAALLSKVGQASLRTERPQSGEMVMPQDFIVGAGHFRAGIKVDTVQGAVIRLYEHMQMLESELGRLCWHCKSAIYPGEPKKMFNPAPNAASGGTWVAVHEKCPTDPLKAFQDRLAAAEAEEGKS